MAEVETLEDWSDEQKAALGVTAIAQYGALSETIRGSMAETNLCSMFCGGKNCKYESAVKWTAEQQAIEGLYSSWITSNILAMARPNTELIKKHDMISQFLNAGIRAIINLQLCGEHASCGPTLEPSGFTYVPQDFMDNNVFFYNFGWHDYNVGSLSGIADAVRVMQFALAQGKVAVHCHAGLGRTGVLIACYLIFANRLDPDIAINYVRRKRPGSVQSRCQIKCIRDFAEYLRPSRIIFSSVKPKIETFTLNQFLSRQKLAVHGNDARHLRYLPKIILVCCERLLDLASRLCDVEEHKVSLFISSDRFLNRNSDLIRSNLFYSADRLQSSSSDQSSKSIISSSIQKNPLIAAIAMRTSISYDSLAPIQKRTTGIYDRKSPIMGALSMTVSSPGSGEGLDLPPLLNEPIHSWSNVRRDDLAAALTTARHRPGSMASTVSSVVDAMGSTRIDYASDCMVKVNSYKQRLNASATVWWELRMENDPAVLACLMWDWLDELKEPVVSIQDLPLLLDGASRPVATLNYLEKGARQTVAYLFYTIACLEPMSRVQRDFVMQRAISTFTQQTMATELDDTTSVSMNNDDRARVLSRSMNEGQMKADVARRLRDFFEHYLRQIKPCSCVAERTASRRLDVPMTSGRMQHCVNSARQK